MTNLLLEKFELAGLWLSQDGNTVPIMDMDDKHLAHAYMIAMNNLRDGYSVFIPKLHQEMMDRNLIVKFGQGETPSDAPLNEMNKVIDWCDKMLSQENNNIRFERDMNELRNNLVDARRFA